MKPYEEEVNTTLIRKYQTYRKIGRELNHKIIKACLDRDVVMKSARLLGITQGDTLIFDTEDEISVLMDFALNEYQVNRDSIKRFVSFFKLNKTDGIKTRYE
jgi:hypothetical protein